MATKPIENAMRQMQVDQAAVKKCPVATQDITVNLKNRGHAITQANYGPENPDLPNVPFWKKKADTWDVSVNDAKKSRCGNCAVFNVSVEIRDCIANGIGNEADPWGSIKLADMGYCEIFDFKCAATRTCDAWVVGGPNDGEQSDDTEMEPQGVT